MKKKYHIFAVSPLPMLLAPWLLVLFLYSLEATTNLIPIPSTVFLFFSVIFVGIFLFQLLAFAVPGRKIPNPSNRSTDALYSYLKRVGALWIIGSILDIVFSGGLPIFWAIQGSSKDYTDFGIASVHGLMNGLYFFLTGGLATIYFQNKRKKDLLIICLLLTWPVLMLGRGILLTALVQLMVIYLFFNGIAAKVVIKLCVVSVVALVSFGLVGDLRGTENPFQYLISDGYQSYFDELPSGFLWMYIYITSPISNYSFNVNSLEPAWSFGYSVVNLFPSILRPSNLDRADNFDFVDAGLNVSTIFASSHSDFGYFGDAILVTLLIAWAFFWFLKVRRSTYFIMPYAIVCCVLVFSVFYNLFLLYPYLFSTVLQGYIAQRCAQKS